MKQFRRKGGSKATAYSTPRSRASFFAGAIKSYRCARTFHRSSGLLAFRETRASRLPDATPFRRSLEIFKSLTPDRDFTLAFRAFVFTPRDESKNLSRGSGKWTIRANCR